MSRDAIELTKSLLRFDTINPPGQERECARHCGKLLEDWGYQVDYHEYADKRTSVVARAGKREAPLCLTGHIDTVALGARKWSKDPFAAEEARREWTRFFKQQYEAVVSLAGTSS